MTSLAEHPLAFWVEPLNFTEGASLPNASPKKQRAVLSIVLIVA